MPMILRILAWLTGNLKYFCGAKNTLDAFLFHFSVIPIGMII